MVESPESIGTTMLTIGKSLEGVDFFTYRNGKPKKISFADGNADEVEPIIMGTAEAMNVQLDLVRIVAGGVRVAHQIGDTYEHFHGVMQGIMDLGLAPTVMRGREAVQQAIRLLEYGFDEQD